MSIAYNTSCVRSGLLLHLDAANKKSYPGTGTTWYDISGNGRNSTLSGGAVFNSNSSASNFYFDGVNDLLTTPSLPTIPLNGFTVVMTFKPETPASVTWNYMLRQDAGGGHLYEMGVYNTIPGFALKDNINGTSTWLSRSFSTFGFLVFGISPTYYTFMSLNGESIEYSPGNAWSGGANINFSSLFTSYKASLNNLMIYNRQLSQEEINKNFESVRKRFSL